MASRHNNSKSLRQAGQNVKGRIVSSGIRFGVLAEGAGISNGALTHYFNGALANHNTQIRIWEAFCRLSGQKISLQEFWGKLLSERIAS